MSRKDTCRIKYSLQQRALPRCHGNNTCTYCTLTVFCVSTSFRLRAELRVWRAVTAAPTSSLTFNLTLTWTDGGDDVSFRWRHRVSNVVC